MVKNAMGYGALPWDHERALEVEVELAAWLIREIPGRIIWTGTGPDIRERFKPKFNLVVFSSPDFVFAARILKHELNVVLIVGVLKRHGGRWIRIRDLARGVSGALGAPFSERKAGAIVRELGFRQFKRDAKGRPRVFVSPNVLRVL